MPATPARPEFWVDELLEKHECGPYRDPVALPFHHRGQAMTLIAPWEWQGTAEVLPTTLSDSGDLLSIVAQDTHEDAYLGVAPVLIVARRRGPDEYAVVIWHELYP